MDVCTVMAVIFSRQLLSFWLFKTKRNFPLFPGVDVTANQDEISSHETFQLEFDWATRRWYIRTMQDRYWTLETGGGIQASGDNKWVKKDLTLLLPPRRNGISNISTLVAPKRVNVLVLWY